MAKCNARQEIFAIEYAKSLDEDVALKAAGYVPRNEGPIHMGAGRLLEIPHVVERVEELLRERALRLQIDGDMIVRELWENAKLARTNKDIKEANNALKLIGMHLGMFKTHEQAGAPQVAIAFVRQSLNAGEDGSTAITLVEGQEGSYAAPEIIP